MGLPIIQTSFAAGELSPSLYARVDLAKYHVGLAKSLNFFVDYRGGVSNRSGTRFIGRARAATNQRLKLIPFQFSIFQNYVLEFGNFYMRVIKDGAYVLDSGVVVTGVSNTYPSTVTAPGHGYSNGDQIFFVNMNGMPGLNGRFGIVATASTNDFQLLDIFGNILDTRALGTYTGAGIVSRVYTLTTPYAWQDVPYLKYTQDKDVMTITHASYPVYNLSRTGHAAWTLAAESFDVAIGAPGGLTATASAAGTITYAYCVTGVDNRGNESIASAIAYVFSADLSVTPVNSIHLAWNPLPNALFYKVYKTYRTAFAVSSADTPPFTAGQFGLIGQTAVMIFDDTNILPDYSIRPPNHYDPFAPMTIESVAVTAGGTGLLNTDVITITDSTGSGALLQPVIAGGALKSVIVVKGGKNYTAPVLSIGGGAAMVATVGPATGTTPGTVNYFQQRRVYAGSANEPQRFWMSQPGLFSNFDRSLPIKDDDAITGALISKQVNNIRSLLAMTSGLIALTGGSAWQINGGSQGAAVTPKSISATSQSYGGISANLDPIVINYDILYVQSLGSIVRDLSYNYFANVYTGNDITVLSNHLFYNHQITSWTYAEEPFKLVWACREDGRLLSLTFLKEQDVYGWAPHETRGQFTEVCSIIEGFENAVYLAVNRRLNGQWIVCIERMVSRNFKSVEEGWFLDCALDYPLGQILDGTLLAASATSGRGVTFNTNSSRFTSFDVGKHLRMGGGMAVITGRIDAFNVLADIVVPITDVIPGTNIPLLATSWSLTAPISVVGGLDHLNGETVGILADGSVLPQQVVVGGKITLQQPASKIIIGLPYISDGQTLNIDTGEPTSQGKRKKIPSVTLRVERTRGLKAGTDFSYLTEIKMRTTEPYGYPIQPFTGDQQLSIDSTFDAQGRLCWRQDYPLPATVLGVIPEVVVGDNFNAPTRS
jgi:hypothetical protein